MLAVDRDALICDLAETYGVFDMGTLPVPMLATLACGLRGNARIKMKLSGSRLPIMESLVAAAVDRLEILIWQNTKDGTKGTNQPKSILAILMDDKKEKNLKGFETAEDFEAEWARRTGVAHGR